MINKWQPPVLMTIATAGSSEAKTPQASENSAEGWAPAGPVS